MPDVLWVEPIGRIIIARIRGECNEEILRECQARVLALVNDTEQFKVLYDTLEMAPPSVDLVLYQQKLESEILEKFDSAQLRKAILVSNTKIAFLARIAFGQHGEGQYRVFYNDMVQAMAWLDE